MGFYFDDKRFGPAVRFLHNKEKKNKTNDQKKKIKNKGKKNENKKKTLTVKAYCE